MHPIDIPKEKEAGRPRWEYRLLYSAQPRMKLSIDRKGATPVYQQITSQIKEQIMAGILPPGFRLPPERELAGRLGVNRTTVMGAYRELKAEGLVGSHVGKGTVVLAPGMQPNPQEEGPLWEHLLSEHAGRVGTHVINDLLRLANRTDVISFATGIASPELGPLEALAGIEEALVKGRDYRTLLHSPVEGFTSFRQAICGAMERKGCFCQPEEVMVLSGSQQGIELCARTLLDPGDLVIMEEPGFFPAIRAFQGAGARLMGVPLDEQGMRTDLLEQLLSRFRPKLIYTVPNYHNPTGITMSLARRRHLMELARKYRVLVLEDDAYGDLCYSGEPLPALRSMDSAGYVIYLSTFSKIIYPGLRTGWVVAHRRLIHRFAALRQLSDLHTNCLSQWIIERFLTGGGLEAHLGKVCKAYAGQRDAMDKALKQYALPGMEWQLPEGGYYIWCSLPPDVTGSALLPFAGEEGVAFLPGSGFYFSARSDGHIRLNFTFEPPQAIEEGARRLCRAIARAQQAGQARGLPAAVEMNPIV